MQNQEILDHFKKICAIPHCSHETEQLREFLVCFLKENRCEVRVDKHGNIYAYKGAPKLCLQVHYDMVCVGEAPNLELVEKDGVLSAKNSSLGADNGMGVVISLQMVKEFDDIEVLFTNDEEVGLMGANFCEFKTKSKKMLNLDSEEDNAVCIGCAGGVDIVLSKSFKRVKKEGEFYKVCISGLKGGHSGIDIAKNIPNAIKVLAKFLLKNQARLVSIEGGERHNSIPTDACAVACFKNEPKICNDFEYKQNLKIEKLDKNEFEILKGSKKLLMLISAFAQGVRSYNEDVGITNDSINLSVLKIDGGEVEAQFFARSMSKSGLENTKFETEVLAKAFGFDVKFLNQTSPWDPKKTEFSKLVLNELCKFKPNATLKAVHAGLECGILIGKDEKLTACSIGPNIHNPHSVRECVELKSVDVISDVVRNIIKILLN